MAWEEAQRQSRTVVTGDKPMDEMALTLRKLGGAYQDRFNRKPTLPEILYALETVILSAPEDYSA